MAGATDSHMTIASNVTTLLRSTLRGTESGSECEGDLAVALRRQSFDGGKRMPAHPLL